MSKTMKLALSMACEDQLQALKQAGLLRMDSAVTAEVLAYSYFARARLIERKSRHYWVRRP